VQPIIRLEFEEVDKSHFVLLHSQEYKVYQIKDARKFLQTIKGDTKLLYFEFLNGIAADQLLIRKEVLEAASSTTIVFFTKLKNLKFS
jgi:hypothetical protein